MPLPTRRSASRAAPRLARHARPHLLSRGHKNILRHLCVTAASPSFVRPGLVIFSSACLFVLSTRSVELPTLFQQNLRIYLHTNMTSSASKALRSGSIVSRTVQRSLRALGARHWFKSKVSREVARRSITALARRSVIGPASAIEPRIAQQLALHEAAAASAAGTAAATIQVQSSATEVTSAPLTRAATEPTPSTRTVPAAETDGPVDFYAEVRVQPSLFGHSTTPVLTVASCSAIVTRRCSTSHLILRISACFRSVGAMLFALSGWTRRRGGGRAMSSRVGGRGSRRRRRRLCRFLICGLAGCLGAS